MKQFVFANVNVVTMKDQSILEGQDVWIKDGLITSMEDAQEDRDFPDATVIDGKGRYLMPGLIDMHVHLGDNKDDLLLFLVNGVTTIRNMWGYEKFRLLNWLMGTRVFHHLRLRDAVEAGDVLGPRIVTAGPMLEGEKPFFPKFMVKRVRSASQAKEMVSQQAAKGYDFLKCYSTLSKEVFEALVEAARERDIPLAGHVPDEVGLRAMLEAKVASVEHLLGFFNPYEPGLAVAPEERRELAALSAENGVYHCPTLIASERICNLEAQESYEAEPEMEFLPKRVKKGMRFLMKASAKHFAKRGLKPNHEYLPFLFEMVQLLKEEGASIILGTDKATPYVAAGFSAHRELKLLQEAGLSPFEALEAGTVNAARCLRREELVGTVEVGKQADLLLVKENPLQELDTAREHCGVMTRGHWLSRKDCDEILARMRRGHDD